jgi:hypothetical protein
MARTALRCEQTRCDKKKRKTRKGRGLGKVLKRAAPAVASLVPSLLNRAVDALPVELHLPGYNFCGPGTKLEARLARGDRGINALDEACREHDIAYATYKDNERRRVADRKLAAKAWERVKAWNSGVSERAYAAAVAAAMKAKSTLGSGLCCRRRATTKKKKKTVKRRTTRRGGSVRKRNVTKRTTASGLYLRPYRKN